MPLRKKHVRRIVAALLILGVFGPLVALAVYGLRVHGRFNDALKRELESRLRCQATVRGARLAGVGAASVDEVRMSWSAGPGQLTVVLGQVEAKAGDPPGAWSVTAASGSLDLAGPRPLETLSALNQRLVQSDPRLPIAGLAVDKLQLSAETDCLAITDTVKLEADVTKKGAVMVRLMRRAGPGGAPNEGPDAVLHLEPTSPAGLLRSLSSDVNDFPAGQVRVKSGGKSAPREAAGTFDLDLAWPAPVKGKTPPRLVEIVGHKLSLADWTGGMRGGPMTGTAELLIAWKKEGEQPEQLEVRLSSPGGRLSAETLQDLAELPCGVCGAGRLLKGDVAYSSAALALCATGTQGRFAGQADLWGRIPLIEIRLLGYPVPILWAGPGPFDAAAAWTHLDKAFPGAGAADASREGAAKPAATPAGK